MITSDVTVYDARKSMTHTAQDSKGAAAHKANKFVPMYTVYSYSIDGEQRSETVSRVEYG